MRLIYLLCFIVSCSFFQNEEFRLKTKSGKEIRLRLAIQEEDQRRGLSGTPSSKFLEDEGLLFIYQQMGPRKFWMPDTYFDLDIIFLSEDLTILHIERDVPNHPGRQEPPPIAITPIIMSNHVLEMRSDSKLAKSLSVGEKFIWKAPFPLSEIVLKTHLQK